MTELDSLCGIEPMKRDEGWFVALRGLFVNVDHRTCVLGFTDGYTLGGRMQPTRFNTKAEAMRAAQLFQASLTGRDAELPVRVVYRQRVLHETQYDIVTGHERSV